MAGVSRSDVIEYPQSAHILWTVSVALVLRRRPKRLGASHSPNGWTGPQILEAGVSDRAADCVCFFLLGLGIGDKLIVIECATQV